MRRFLLIALIWTIVTLPGGAQETKPIHLPFDGPEFFCHILFSKGLTEVATFEEALEDPKDTMVILLGAMRGPDTQQFKPFLDAGGNLLIATDRTMSFKDLGLSVDGIPVRSRDYTYRRSVDCPVLTYKEGADGLQDARTHPLFQLLSNSIAANCPSRIVRREGFPGHDLLNFQTEEAGIRTYMVGSPKDAPPEGRMLVIAGHGMFMNGMMLQPDNDNFAFSVNAVNWLHEGADGRKRAKALFMVDGRAITNFNMNLTPPPPKLPMPTVAMLNRLLRGLENEDFFHRIAVSLLGERFKYVVPIFLVLATAFLLLYGGKKFLDGRHLRDNAAPRLVGEISSIGGEPGSRAEQRQQALIRQKNAWAAAHRLVEQWFQSEFAIEPQRWSAGVPVTFQATGSFLSRGPLLRHANRVLFLAQTNAAEPVDLAALVRALPALSAALRDRRLTLLLDGKEVRQTAEETF